MIKFESKANPKTDVIADRHGVVMVRFVRVKLTAIGPLSTGRQKNKGGKKNEVILNT